MKKTRLFLTTFMLAAGLFAQAQDETVYTFAGYDAGARKMVNFDFTAADGGTFTCADAPEGQGLSEYGFVKGQNLYTFTNDGTQQTMTVQNAETFELVSTAEAAMAGQRSVPYAASFDPQRGFTYAFSCEKQEGVGERYYLNAIDLTTGEVKRVGTFGYWYDDETKTSIAPQNILFNSGTAYFTYFYRKGGQTKLYIGQFNTGTLQITGTPGIVPIEGVEKGVSRISFFLKGYTYYLAVSADGQQNSTIYQTTTAVPYGSTTGEVTLTKQVDATVCLVNCYQRPSTITVYNKNPYVGAPDDLDISIEGTKVTVTLTVPDKDENGDPLALQEWAQTNDYSRSVNLGLYVDNTNATVTKPEGVQYFFPGDKATFYCDLATAVYGLTNPNGLHAFSVNIQPQNGYSNQPLRVGQMKLVGGAKPEPVTNATIQKSGSNCATFTWTAPTATELADWGYEFDASALSYRIVRNNDGTVVADGITGTTAEVDNLAKEPGDYDFSIIAIADGTTSAAVSTDAIFCEPPTYDFMGYNLDQQKLVAFNVEPGFGHIDWGTNADIANMGYAKDGKLYTFKYQYTKTQYTEYYSQTYSIFDYEALVRQGYSTSNYWYPKNGQQQRSLVGVAYNPVIDLTFGVAADSVRNDEGVATSLRYFVCQVDTVGSYQLQNKMMDFLPVEWGLNGEDGKAVVAVGFFQGQGYAAVVCRDGGKESYGLFSFDPVAAELEQVAGMSLAVPAPDARQFFMEANGKFYLGYNSGSDNTVLYELNVETGAVTEAVTMDGVYTYTFQREKAKQHPALQLDDLTALTTEKDAETGKVKVSLAVPTAAADNNAVTVTLLEDGKAIEGAEKAAQMGDAVTFEDVEVSNGLHALTAVVAPADVNVGGCRAAAWLVIGDAKPAPVKNAAAEMFGDNECNVSWTAPTTSAWADFGATLPADVELTYVVVLNQTGETLVDDCVDAEFYVEQIANADGNYDFTVYAVNGTQTSYGAKTNTVTVTTPTTVEAAMKAAVGTQAVYNLQGRSMQSLSKGINIVRRADGRMVKVVVK